LKHIEQELSTLSAIEATLAGLAARVLAGRT
jgi:hypothetical protein